MIVLITLAVIFAILAFILCLRIKIVIKYIDELSVYVKILFVKIRITPRKKKKIKISDYSLKKIQKREKKAAEKELKAKIKKEKKKAAKAAKEKEKEEKPGILENLKLIANLVGALLKYFFKYLRIDVSKIVVNVASEDAAKTAIMYGAVYQGVAYITELLDNTANLKKKKDSEISVYADFVSDKLSADINITFSILVWQVMAICLHVAIKYLKSKIKIK